MSASIIIIVILYAIAAVFAFKLIKSVVKALFLVSAVALILIALGSFFIYKDVVDMKDNWPDSQKLLLLESDDMIITGFESTLSTTETPVFLTASQISSLNSDYENNNLDSMLGSNYKMIIMDINSIADEVEAEEVTFNDLTLKKSDIISVINSENSLDFMIDKIVEDRGLPADQRGTISSEVANEFGDSARIKAMAFGLLVSQLFVEKGQESGLFIFQQYKAGNIGIYKETAIFKTMKFIPDFILEKAGEIAMSKMVEE